MKLTHQEIMTKFEQAQSYFKDDYTRNKEDAEFALGEQWPDDIKNQRENEKRPCLTENRMLPFVMQVVNDIRQTRPQVLVKPVNGEADVKIAEILGGMIRNIQNVNDAETVYDTAAYNAVTAAYGWIRLGTKYSDYNSFDQEITIDRIVNPFSVMIDPFSTKIDASDAEFIFIFDNMSEEDFKEQYPKADLSSFDVDDHNRDWNDGENVRVAEYYYKHYTRKTIVEFEMMVDGRMVSAIVDKEDLPEGAEIIQEREVDECSIKHCKLSGKEILEKNDVVGQFIPIVPVYGLETWKDDKRTIFSLIHQAKDPQRMFNYWKSASTEIMALQPKTPYIAAQGQIAKYKRQWQNANNTPSSVLYYDPKTVDGILVPAPQRVQPPTGSSAMLQETVMAADGIKSTLGMYDATLGQQTNDISGKAIISRQMQGENSTFHFVDNLAASMRHVGRILIDMIPLIYTGKQVIRVLGEDGQEKMIPINQPVVKEGGEYREARVEDANDKLETIKLDAGKYDVIVEVGASYATKRQELANTLLELARVYPEIMNIAGDMLVKNLDFPEAETISKRIRSQMDPTLINDDAEDERLVQLSEALQQVKEQLKERELALQIKDDNQQFKNNIEQQKVDVDKLEATTDAAYKAAQIAKLNAETNIEIPAEAAKDMSDAVQQLKGQVEDMHGALDVILSHRESEASGVPETPAINGE